MPHIACVNLTLPVLRAEEGQLDFNEGISLLTLKCNMMVQYLQSLVLLSAHRILGNSMDERSPPAEPFSDPNRGPRGTGGGDMVDAATESRLVLEKIMLMEDKMKHQIDKLIQAANEEPESSEKSPNGQVVHLISLSSFSHALRRSFSVQAKSSRPDGRGFRCRR